ncbi:MAG: gliding motility-associated C-terminal domain-containing protein, partial [Pedobacter sp.]
YNNAGTAPTFKWFKNGVQVATSINYLASRLRNEDEIHCEITGSEPCSAPIISDKIKVTVNSLPVIKFDGDVTLENDGPKLLSPQINDNIVSYSWAPTIGLDNLHIKNPRANPENTTTYTLTVIGEGGCIAQAKVRVVVLKEIFIPNVFSPNGDGKNDQWVIRNIADYIGTKVQIFNRYGQRVFHSDNFVTPWDGMLGGNQLPIGSYYYILDLANKSKKRYTGSVTILR